MYASARRYHQYAVQVRWLARAMAVTLFAAWLALVLMETTRPNPPKWPIDLYVQGAVLAVVFAGYAIGWRKELVGGLVAILGTAALYGVLAVTEFVPRDMQMVWFAVPGALYLLARRYDRRADKGSDAE